MNFRVAKKEMQREIDELERQNGLTMRILNALRSDHQVPAILKLLKEQENLVLIADIAGSPSAMLSSVSPPLGMFEDVSQETRDSAARTAVESTMEEVAPDLSGPSHY